MLYFVHTVTAMGIDVPYSESNLRSSQSAFGIPESVVPLGYLSLPQKGWYQPCSSYTVESDSIFMHSPAISSHVSPYMLQHIAVPV